MKRHSIFLTLLFSLTLFTFSCNDDDNDGESIAPLAGKWGIKQIGTTVDGKEVLVDAPQNEDGCDRDYINLKIDNTLIEGDYDSSVSQCALTTKEGIYSRLHNDLTRVIDGVTRVQDIANLTFQELKLKDDAGNIELYIREN